MRYRALAVILALPWVFLGSITSQNPLSVHSAFASGKHGGGAHGNEKESSAKQGGDAHGKEENSKEHAKDDHGKMPRNMGGMKGFTPLEMKGMKLVTGLHCNACHYIGKELDHGAGHQGGHGAVAPDLTFLGDKFRASWLFEYLQKPHVVRPWLSIRMPTFRLTEADTVALVKHLTQDMRERNISPSRLSFKVDRKTLLSAGRKLSSKDYFDCFGCHQVGEKKPDKPMNEWAPDLQMAARRLRPEWIVRWIQGPQKMIPNTRMPTFFEDADSGPDDVLAGNEEKQIWALREFVLSLGKKKNGTESYDKAVKRYPKATAARGARLMSALNCAGCHDVGSMHERREAGPPLAHEGSRVRKEWLASYLKKPYRVRPLGYSGERASRMPDFRLSKNEVNAISAFLMTRKDMRSHEDKNPHAESKKKIRRGEQLFSSLRCGACHAVKSDKEKNTSKSVFLGPSLADAGQRLKAGHLVFWLTGDVTSTGSNLDMDFHPLIPQMKLKKSEVSALIAFIMSVK